MNTDTEKTPPNAIESSTLLARIREYGGNDAIALFNEWFDKKIPDSDECWVDEKTGLLMIPNCVCVDHHDEKYVPSGRLKENPRFKMIELQLSGSFCCAVHKSNIIFGSYGLLYNVHAND